MQPSAVALPNSQPVGASGAASRVVPIFNSANSQQPVMTGYLYSSRIVFAIVPLSGSPDFYVGLPKSLASTTGGRVKVAKVFASQSIPNLIGRYSFAFNRFAVFVLEKDLIAATPAELLTPEMDIEGDFPRVTTAYSYGEYQDRTSPGSQNPCEGGPCSKDVRSLQLRILALKGKPPVSVMPNFPDQFTGQIILENSVDPKAGIACYGDGGAPVVASYRNRDLYMGAIADQFYVKACGAYPKATYDKNGNMITFGYDTDIAISFISPVYKHTNLINQAKDYAKRLATPSPTPSTKSATPSPTPSTKSATPSPTAATPSGMTSVSLKTAKSTNHESEALSVTYEGDLSNPKSKPAGFRFFNGFEGELRQIGQIPIDRAKCFPRTTTKEECYFPNFNPYKNIIAKKSPVLLYAAPYNSAGQGPLSEKVIMHELLWKSKNKEIFFQDNVKVIDAIFGSSWSNRFGFKSREATSKLRSTFTLVGPVIPKNYKIKLTLSETNSEKNVLHKLYLTSHKFSINPGGAIHSFEMMSNELKFPGDSKFEVTMNILDQNGFVRAREVKSFSFNYNMDFTCSRGLFTILLTKDFSKISLKTAIAAHAAADTLTFKSGGKDISKNPLSGLFKNPAFWAEAGLNAIEAVEKEDGMEFVIKTGMQINTELAEALAFGVINDSMSPEAGIFIEHEYKVLVTAKEFIELIRDYYLQIDEQAKKNSEDIIDTCGKSGL